MALRFKQFGYVDTYSELPPQADEGQLIMTVDTGATFIMKSNVWLPFARLVVKKSSVTVDGRTTGVVPIYTLEPSNLNFYPTQIIMRAVSITTATLKPTISVGTNATAYDNIATGTLLNSVTTLLGVTSSPQSVSTSPALAGGTVINTNVSVGALATSYTFKIDIIGYYES